MRAWWILFATCLGCSSDVAASARMQLVFGLENAPWDEAGDGSLVVTRIATDGARREHTRQALPREAFALGAGGAAAFEAEVRDASGAAIAVGRSLTLDPLDFLGVDLPLFLGRTGRFSGVAHLAASGANAPAAVIAGRYLLVVANEGQDPVTTGLLDLATWSPTAEPPLLTCPSPPCAFSTLAVTSTTSTLVLALGDDWGLWLDFATLGSARAEAPAGFTFAELAGGRAVTGSDGFVYVVGATRAESATTAVLRLSEDGTALGLRLATPRAGAAVAWAPGIGLVIAGGSAEGAGVEVLPPAETRWRSLGYPPDPTVGAALFEVEGEWRRAGGVGADGAPAATVALDLGCDLGCAPESAEPALDVRRAVAFELESSVPLVVGEGADGSAVALRADGSVVERRPRRFATAIALPTGHVALAGGEAETAVEVTGP